MIYKLRIKDRFSIKIYSLMLSIIFLASCIPETEVTDYVDSDKWDLVWSDEFSGRQLDTQKWSFDIGGHGYGNRELQYYTNGENIDFHNGKLIVEVKKEKYKGNPYTSSKIWTMGKAGWTYGTIVVRAKLPEGKGIWPAVWMLPMDPYVVKWPAGGEIDIVELIGQAPDTVHGTLHYGEPHEYHGGKYVLSDGKFSDDFHVFAVKWEPERITWYLDGKPYYSREDWFSNDMYHQTKYEYPAPFNKDFMLILNVAVGGNWPGYPDKSTEFPQKMEVDFVRVYKNKKQL